MVRRSRTKPKQQEVAPADTDKKASWILTHITVFVYTLLSLAIFLTFFEDLTGESLSVSDDALKIITNAFSLIGQIVGVMK